MTRDCGHSTGDDQRLRTVQGMTRDSAGDDQRLRTLGREGEWLGTHYACARSTALCEWPGVFWDLSCVPEDAR
ncbi:unnamed protein product, partial [Staurois parvus]